MQWMMLQQERAEDYVIATGYQISVRDFVLMSAEKLGITIEFSGEGINEVGVVKSIRGDDAPKVKIGDIIIRVNPRYFRPAEVETLLGDPTKAKENLGWEPEITVEDMCAEMIANDLSLAKQNALLNAHGYNVQLSKED